MEKLVAYKRMPLWNKQTMPEAVQQKHNTKVGTWGKITVLKGALKFIELTEEGEVLAEHLFEAGADNPMAQPQAWHRVEAATDDVEWYLEFYCKPEDYFAKKYNTNPVHSEVLEAMQTVKQGKALDLGCGQGRNSLFLAQQDFDVTAVDQNGLALEILQSIVEQEDLDMPVGLYDINSASADRIPAIIQNMQEKTSVGGYNLIVCAMDTEDYPCSVNFPFTFKEGELADYYKDWELVKYNENPGHLHRRDENGNRIQLRFATLLAKKIK
ncbi:SAM-dependent methyltransferase TehB [Streptococcus pneumoniae]|nr:SAM-dependent methyltransferase TehB [Streptococcus pneumoniae]MDS6131239.1 SAM-dependent methyltransferase TehB [Streptococcus pneumoniae]